MAPPLEIMYCKTNSRFFSSTPLYGSPSTDTNDIIEARSFMILCNSSWDITSPSPSFIARCLQYSYGDLPPHFLHALFFTAPPPPQRLALTTGTKTLGSRNSAEKPPGKRGKVLGGGLGRLSERLKVRRGRGVGGSVKMVDAIWLISIQKLHLYIVFRVRVIRIWTNLTILIDWVFFFFLVQIHIGFIYFKWTLLKNKNKKLVQRKNWTLCVRKYVSVIHLWLVLRI